MNLVFGCFWRVRLIVLLSNRKEAILNHQQIMSRMKQVEHLLRRKLNKPGCILEVVGDIPRFTPLVYTNMTLDNPPLL